MGNPRKQPLKKRAGLWDSLSDKEKIETLQKRVVELEGENFLLKDDVKELDYLTEMYAEDSQALTLKYMLVFDRLVKLYLDTPKADINKLKKIYLDYGKT